MGDTQSPRQTIRLNGITYEVRVVEGVPEINHGGTWKSRVRFVEALRDVRDYDSLCDLARIGMDAIRGTLFLGSPRRTADALHGARHN